MNYNTSVYPNSVTGMAEDFEIRLVDAFNIK